eukprot:scaffold13271_cov31-Prasinocladus_malaysianus.AAC.1
MKAGRVTRVTPMKLMRDARPVIRVICSPRKTWANRATNIGPMKNTVVASPRSMTLMAKKKAATPRAPASPLRAIHGIIERRPSGWTLRAAQQDSAKAS